MTQVPHREKAVILAFLSAHTFLAAHAAIRTSPTIDEPGHLLSGVLLWRRGNVEYYRLNPPLVKMIQAVPLLAVDLELPDTRGPATVDHWVDAKDEFLEANRDRFFETIRLARFASILFSVATGWLIYRWSRDLFGPAAGLVGLFLWTACPKVLGWAGVCTADVGTAFFALAAMMALRVYLPRPSLVTALWFGLLLGLAQLSRFSLLVLYPVAFALWFSTWLRREYFANDGLRPRWREPLAALAVSLLVRLRAGSAASEGLAPGAS